MAIKTIKLTPVGLSTPEGSARVAAALKAFEESHATVANAATQFIERYQYEIKHALNSEDGAGDELAELLEMIAARSVAQDDFLRAVAGAPAR
jgi:hypothetical protein